MTVDRLLPTAEARDLLALVRDIADKELAPRVDEHEQRGDLPRGAVRHARRGGPAGAALPGGVGRRRPAVRGVPAGAGGVGGRWAAVAVAVSVQALACHPVAAFGTPEQQERWLPPLLGGRAARRLLAVRAAGRVRRRRAARARPSTPTSGYRITGTKAWITHGGKADLYALFARTGPGSGGISCFLAPGHAEGCRFGKPEEKMGLHAIPTTTAHWDGVADRRRPARRPARARACRSRSARSTPGRLGIAAVATGLAQAALDAAVAYAARAHGVRPHDHRPRGAGLPARRHGRGRRLRPRHLPRRRPPPRRGPALQPPGRGGEARRDRRRDEGDHRRRPGARRLRLHPRLPASSATCARPRSPRSSRAPTRSSGSSSAVTWPGSPDRRKPRFPGAGRRPAASPPARPGR